MLPTILQKKVFEVSPDLLGNGRVIFQWSPKGNYLAAAGPKVRRMASMGRTLIALLEQPLHLHGHACMRSGKSTSLIAMGGSTTRSRCPSLKCSCQTRAARPAWSCRCVDAAQSEGVWVQPSLREATLVPNQPDAVPLCFPPFSGIR